VHESLLPVVFQVAALVLAVCFHESAHGWVALQCGDPTARDLGRISLNPLKHIDPFGSVLLPAMLAYLGAPVFGWAKPVPVALSRTRQPRSANLLISAAGPLSNLLLAALFALVVALLQRRGAGHGEDLASGALMLFAAYAVVVNVVLAVFNLLPIPPLDGFGVLESLLPRSLAGIARGLRRYGMLVLLLLMFSGALNSLLLPAQRFVIRSLLHLR
jgi:Zn-dependent protease